MTSLSRILVTITIGIGIAVVGVVLYLTLADLNKFKPNIEAAVSEATGREFRINGDLQLDALPTPAIVMEDISLQNVEWGSVPTAVEIGHLSAEIVLLSLISGPIEVRKLQINDVNIMMESSDGGIGNFDSDPVDEQNVPPVDFGLIDDEWPLFVHRADMSNITITHRKPGQEDQAIRLTSFHVGPNDAGNPAFDGSVDILGLPLTFSGDYTTSTLDASFAAADVRATVSARIVNDGIGVELTIDTLEQMGAALGVAGLPAAELFVSGTVVPGSRETEFRNVSATIGEAELVANGNISHSDGAATLTLKASASSLNELLTDLPALPFSASTVLKTSADVLHLSELDVKLGDSDLSGEFHLTNGETRQIEGIFTFELLDFTPFMAAEEEIRVEVGVESEAANPPEDEIPSSKYVFDDKPFDFEEIRLANIKLKANVGRLRAGTVDIRDLILKTVVVDGDVDLEASASGKGDGRVAIEMLLNTEGENADLQLLLQFKDLNINVMSGDVPADQVPSTDLTIEVGAAGTSPHALASSANGHLLLTQGPGTIANEMIGKVSGDIIAQLFTALNPFTKDEEFSKWDCTVFSMNITDGVSEIDGFLMQGEKIQIVGAGSIDLSDEKINIEFNTKPRTGVGLTADSFVTPFVKMSGTLVQPGIGLNEKGVILSGSIAIATAGLSLLVQGAADRATAGADACVDALAAAGEHAAITKR